MRLLDEVVDVVAGERATGRRMTAATDFYFQGHFPGQPIVRAWRRPWLQTCAE